MIQGGSSGSASQPEAVHYLLFYRFKMGCGRSIQGDAQADEA